MEAVIL